MRSRLPWVTLGAWDQIGLQSKDLFQRLGKWFNGKSIDCYQLGDLSFGSQNPCKRLDMVVQGSVIRLCSTGDGKQRQENCWTRVGEKTWCKQLWIKRASVKKKKKMMKGEYRDTSFLEEMGWGQKRSSPLAFWQISCFQCEQILLVSWHLSQVVKIRELGAGKESLWSY